MSSAARTRDSDTHAVTYPTGPRWQSRDFAARLARTMGVSETAIRSVMTKFCQPSYQTRKPVWWGNEFQLADRVRP